jgi:hypothetical protein
MRSMPRSHISQHRLHSTDAYYRTSASYKTSSLLLIPCWQMVESTVCFLSGPSNCNHQYHLISYIILYTSIFSPFHSQTLENYFQNSWCTNPQSVLDIPPHPEVSPVLRSLLSRPYRLECQFQECDKHYPKRIPYMVAK